MNDSIIIGIKAIGTDANITNLEIKRTNENNNTITLLNEGFNIGVLELDRIFTKGIDKQETYTITVMDKNRNSASVTLQIYKDSTSTFTNIYYHKSIKLGYQNNSTYGHYLDPLAGKVYNDANVGGLEQNIHIVVYYYVSSGKPSPTLVCPAQADAMTTYPNISNWAEKNATRYDYHASVLI